MTITLNAPSILNLPSGDPDGNLAHPQITRKELQQRHRAGLKHVRAKEFTRITNAFTFKRKILLLCNILFWLSLIFVFRHHLFGMFLHNTTNVVIAIIFSINLLYLLLKLLLALFYRPITLDLATVPTEKLPTVSIVMPSFNEPTENVIKAFHSLLSQTYPIKEILFIDDGSTDASTYEAVTKFAAARNQEFSRSNLPTPAPEVITHRFTQNQGKRAAQIWGFTQASGELIQLADSDSLLEITTIAEMVKPFIVDPQVGSVVGYIAPNVVKHNFLIMLQDMLYNTAFNVSRAAQSILGSVVVCSGALGLIRRQVTLDNLAEFQKEVALGVPLKSGDDRLLTELTRRSGYRTVYQSTAIAVTDVPDNISQFISQQSRWMKSAWLQSLHLIAKRPWSFASYAIFSILDVWLFVITTIIGLVISLLTGFELDLSTQHFAWIGIYYFLIAYLSRTPYLLIHGMRYLATPIYTLVFGILLFRIRIKTLFSLRKESWQTR